MPEITVEPKKKISIFAILPFVLLGIPFVLGVVAAAIIIRGFILTVLWGWFAVPLGLPALSIPMALGLSILTAYVVGNDAKIISEMTDENGKKVSQKAKALFYVLTPLFVLLMGYITYCYV